MAALTTQLEAMRGVRTENTELQDKNLALVGQLRAREEELERLLREQVGQTYGFRGCVVVMSIQGVGRGVGPAAARDGESGFLEWGLPGCLIGSRHGS